MRRHILIIDAGGQVSKELRDMFPSHYDTAVCQGMEETVSFIHKEYRHLHAVMFSNIRAVDGGMEILKMLHTNEDFTQIPVFVLSDEADDDIGTSVLKLGAEYFFAEPYNKEHLLCCLENIISMRKAAALAAEMELQQEVKIRYEKEHRIRQRMMENAEVYYELNLTEGYINEYHSKFGDVDKMKAGARCGEKLREALLERVYEKDRLSVRKAIFSDALLEAYENGETSKEVTYRRYIPVVTYTG